MNTRESYGWFLHTGWVTNHWGVSLVVSAVIYWVLAVLFRSLGLPAEFLAVLFLIPTLAVGSVVVAGGVAGVLLVGLSDGSLGAWTLVTAVEFAVLVGIVAALWGRVGLVAPGAPPTMTSRRHVAEYLLALAVGGAATLAAVGWLVVVLGLQPYYTGYAELVTVTLMAAVGVPPALYLLGRGASPDERPAGGNGTDRAGSLRRTGALLIVSTGWFVVGSGVATVAHDFGKFPHRTALSASIADTFGTGTVGRLAFDVIFVLYRFGDIVVIAVGLVAIAMLVWLWPADWPRMRAPAEGGR